MPQTPASVVVAVATKIETFEFDTGHDRLELSDILTGVECERNLISLFRGSMAPGKGVCRGKIMTVGDEKLNLHGIMLKMGARIPHLTPIRLGSLQVRAAFRQGFGDSQFSKDGCRNVFFSKGAGATLCMLTFLNNGHPKLDRVNYPHSPITLKRGDRVMWAT